SGEDYTQDRYVRVKKITEDMMGLSSNPTNRARMEKIVPLADSYLAGAREIAALKKQIIGMQSKSAELSAADASRVAALAAEGGRIAADKLPVVNEMNKLADEIVDFAKRAAEEANAESARLKSNAELLSVGFSGLTVLLLIGTAIFGALS